MHEQKVSLFVSVRAAGKVNAQIFQYYRYITEYNVFNIVVVDK